MGEAIFQPSKRYREPAFILPTSRKGRKIHSTDHTGLRIVPEDVDSVSDVSEID